MNWEFVGAVAGILALAVTIFLEWPKLMERLSSIPPIVFIILFTLLLYLFAMITIGIFFTESVSILYRSIALVGNIALNLIIIAVGDYSKRYATDEIDRSAIYWIASVFIYFELIIIYIGIVNPFGWGN